MKPEVRVRCRAPRESCSMPGMMPGEPPTHMGALFPPIHDLRRNSFKMFLEMCIKCNKAFEL